MKQSIMISPVHYRRNIEKCKKDRNLADIPAYRKKYKKIKKTLAFTGGIEYNNPCCDIDSVEAKVAMHDIGFSWSECQLTITGDKSLYSITIWQVPEMT